MRRSFLLTTALVAAALALPAAAGAAPAPAWGLQAVPMPANFAPGFSPEPEYMIVATNIGGGPTTADAEIEATLPAGLVPKKVESASGAACSIVAQTVHCEAAAAIYPGKAVLVLISVEVAAAPGVYLTEASVSGGGAAQEASASVPTRVQAGPLPFGFLEPGLSAPLTAEDGSAAVLAGSHPFQQSTFFAFPTENPGDGITNSGHPRNFYVELPRGMSGDPAATPVLCTEAELTGSAGCPEGSQVGLAGALTLAGEVADTVFTTPLYNMVPPPGYPAELATDVATVGIFAHVLAGVRSEGDYGVRASVRDVLSLGTQPIFGLQAQVWGDPSAPSHDQARGSCFQLGGACPVDPVKTAFLTTPAECPDTPLELEVHADSWEKPAPAFEEQRTVYESADPAGNPVVQEGCGEQPFEPSIEAKLSTDFTDSPAGLDFALHQPQDMDLDSRASAPLKDAAIHFPAGLAVNPAQAAGLDACTEAQIGFTGAAKDGSLRFSAAPQACPDAAKIGSVEVTSPLLVARNEAHEVEEDPEEGTPVLETLHGSLYVARPFENPFGSLLSVYLAVEDQKTGIVAKLAGEAELDPTTGRITARFADNPELPLQGVRVHVFGGDRGALVTPSACGAYSTESQLTPWSTPKGEDAFPTAGFALSRAPGGGPCPRSEAELPAATALSAGTESPAAAAYSPLLFKLSREDGSQRIARIEASMPLGLSAKLAGVAQCSEADITKARSREAPRLGAVEQADPSCPAASEVGTIVAGAGAGPHPYYTSGHAYLAGPYRGAPLSLVAIVPAVAGPFDLGAVVSRIALYVDPTSARVRAVSDPLPQVLDGVPVDLRSIALRAGRAEFTRTPTSCSEKAFEGSAFSPFGSAAPLFERFQVGGCSSLPYKPRMKVNLYGPSNRGAHPRLKAVFTARPGEANTAKVSFTFPKSEFIDQAHFRTICTRVQFAADQCPAGSVYGHVIVYTPLFDYPLEGNAYLRSSSHKLPDLVIALKGPASQPIEVDAAGRVDSVNGGLRVRFEEVPDAPITRLIVNTQGAKKGLFQNSTNICKGTHRATLKLDAQNGATHDTQPKLVAQCKKGKGGRGKGAAKNAKGK